MFGKDQEQPLKFKKLSEIPIPDYIKPLLEINEMVWNINDAILPDVITNVNNFIKDNQEKHELRFSFKHPNQHFHDFEKVIVDYNESKLIYIIDLITVVYEYRVSQRKFLIDLLISVCADRVVTLPYSTSILIQDIQKNKIDIKTQQKKIYESDKKYYYKTFSLELGQPELREIFLNDDVQKFEEILNNYEVNTNIIFQVFVSMNCVKCIQFLEEKNLLPKFIQYHPLMSGNLDLIKKFEKSYSYSFKYPAACGYNDIIEYMLEKDYKIEDMKNDCHNILLKDTLTLRS